MAEQRQPGDSDDSNTIAFGTPDSCATCARRRRTSDVLRVGGGSAVLAASWWLAVRHPLHPAEAGANRSVNRLHDRWRLVWPVMQVGNLAAVPLAAGVARVFDMPRSLSAALLASGLAAWTLAKPIKAIVGRERPAGHLPDVLLREEASGLGFVSGHAAVATAMSTVANPYLPPSWRWAPRSIGAIVAVARVYYGAHLPLDVVGGAGLGVAIGGLTNMLTGVPRRQEEDA